VDFGIFGMAGSRRGLTAWWAQAALSLSAFSGHSGILGGLLMRAVIGMVALRAIGRIGPECAALPCGDAGVLGEMLPCFGR
jgi:hypothetical protein